MEKRQSSLGLHGGDTSDQSEGNLSETDHPPWGGEAVLLLGHPPAPKLGWRGHRIMAEETGLKRVTEFRNGRGLDVV